MQNSNYPWDILPEEKPEDYEFFRSYLDLGKHRSYSLVARVKGYSLRTIAAKAAHNDWYNRARNYDAFCFEQSRSIEVDLYKANKDIYFRIRNDVNSKLTNLLRQFSEEFLDETLAADPSPELFKKLKYYQQVFRTINQLNRTIDFDRYPKAELPDMLSWKSTKDKGTFNKQPDSNPEEFIEKIAIDEALDDSAFNAEVGNYIGQNSKAFSANSYEDHRLIKRDENGNVTFAKETSNMNLQELKQTIVELAEDITSSE